MSVLTATWMFTLIYRLPPLWWAQQGCAVWTLTSPSCFTDQKECKHSWDIRCLVFNSATKAPGNSTLHLSAQGWNMPVPGRISAPELQELSWAQHGPAHSPGHPSLLLRSPQCPTGAGLVAAWPGIHLTAVSIALHGALMELGTDWDINIPKRNDQNYECYFSSLSNEVILTSISAASVGIFDFIFFPTSFNWARHK